MNFPFLHGLSNQVMKDSCRGEYTNVLQKYLVHSLCCFFMITGPCGISPRVSLTDVPLEEGMILSDGK